MRVTKHQIIDGLADYIQAELLPKMGKDKGMQIALDVAVNAVKANDRLIDTIFNSDILQAVLQADEAGNYELDSFMESLEASVQRYGALPIEVPHIPLIAPKGGSITLDAADIAAIRERIGGDGHV